MDEYSIRLPRRQEQPCRQTVMESQPELLHYFSSLTPPNKTKENLYQLSLSIKKCIVAKNMISLL